MNEAIKLAIEKGGLDVSQVVPLSLWAGKQGWAKLATEQMFVTSHLFWQAVGKALEWEERYKYYLSFVENECCGCSGGIYDIKPEWQYHAHQYFDLVLTGGSTEKFWKDLLPD